MNRNVGIVCIPNWRDIFCNHPVMLANFNLKKENQEKKRINKYYYSEKIYKDCLEREIVQITHPRQS